MMSYANEPALAQASWSNIKFRELLSNRAVPIAANGAVGRNIASFSDVSAQRDATWNMLLDIESGNTADLSSVVSAMEYGFQHQNSDGSFQFNMADTSQAASAAAFFVGAFGRVYLGISSSNAGSAYASRLQAMLPSLAKAMTWLSGQTSTLAYLDGNTANRLFFDALAFKLAGRILNDAQLVQTGGTFLDSALAQQRADGSFNENGGFDTSYQAVSMLNIEELITYSNDPNDVSRLSTALSNAVNFEQAHISANGQVQVAGNTRTGLGQENGPTGVPKDVNYSEVSLSLYYAGSILGNNAATATASAVSGWALVHTGGVANPTPSESRTSISPDASGTATGTSGGDILTATGHGQTLIGNGGDDIFSIGRNTDTTIVVGGSGRTTVQTTAPSYTLASGVDNVTLGGSYDHTVTGNGGDNYITGSNGNDTINGGGGDVVIRLGTGHNVITGGGHYDLFLFPYAADAGNTITDFKPGNDVIDLRIIFQQNNWSASNVANYITVVQQNANAVMYIDPDGTGAGASHALVTLNNVQASAITPGVDYLFG